MEKLLLLVTIPTLYQGVTLGGTGKEKGKRHPTLEDNVMVKCRGEGYQSIYQLEESKNRSRFCCFGRSLPPNCTVVGVPGRIVRMVTQTFREQI